MKPEIPISLLKERSHIPLFRDSRATTTLLFIVRPELNFFLGTDLLPLSILLLWVKPQCENLRLKPELITIKVSICNLLYLILIALIFTSEIRFSLKDHGYI